jgi:hypothetical protein
VVVGGPEVLKLATQDEQDGPQTDLSQMCDKRHRYRQCDDCKIVQGVCAQASAPFLIAKEIHRRGQSDYMDENRTFDGDDTDCQRKRDCELMIWYHLFPTSIPAYC